MTSYKPDFEIYLKPTPFIDSDSKKVKNFVDQVCKTGQSKTEKAISLYYEVRDRFLYDPYKIDLSVKGLKASSVIENGYGFCIPKAILMIAVARAVDIPSRLHFADVKNHLTSEKLTKIFGDIFVYHGYTELFLEGKWVKATPAFNKTLCAKFNVDPLEFDGKNDSIFQEFDKSGNKYMEYVKERGIFHEVPFDNIKIAFMEAFSGIKDVKEKKRLELEGNFAKEAKKNDHNQTTGNVSIYTDGACTNNPGPGGYGAVIIEGNKRTELSGGCKYTTNNRMEMKACIEALSRFTHKTTALLYTDSKYIADAINKGWAEKWQKIYWMRNREEPALNSDLWKKLLGLCGFHNVKIEWVKGHTGNKENERCDFLATSAAQRKDLPPDLGYAG